MKVITIKEDNIKSPLEECFGKAKFFCFVHEDSCKTEFVQNPCKDLIKHSGKRAVEFLHSKGATSVMSGNYGITVKKMLDKYKIQTVIIPTKYKNLFQILKKLNHNLS